MYFSNLPPEGDSVQIVNNTSAKIQTGDILGISIVTLNPEYNQLFNSGAIPSAQTTTPVTSTNNNELTRNGFQVDGNGQVNLPLLGKITLAGLTREQAQEKITAEVAKTTKDPIVNVKFLNFKITVIGEVAQSGSFNIPVDKVNVLEALGMAGDMTPYAVRDSVLVIREEDGVRTRQRINLNDKDVFNSPYFYLKQNDIVYVQPENKLKARQANANNYRWVPIVTAGISALAIVLSRVFIN
ncbi:polysaccharide biosynthesis/export family protein [Niabella terrae]